MMEVNPALNTALDAALDTTLNTALDAALDTTLDTALDTALVDIRRIRHQLAQTTEFRGYGPLTLCATAVLALLAGAAQARWIADPAARPEQYVALWLATGIVSAALILTQMRWRAGRLHSGMADAMVRMAIAQFLPSGIAGLLLPFVLLHGPRNIVWMLPGLWQVLFGLGVLASCRCLPRALLGAGAWFLLCGFACLWLGDARALAPAAMCGAFAPGMAFVAFVHSLAAGKARVHEDNEA